MASLLLLLFIGLAGFIAWRFYLQRQEEQLRDNPPQRRVIEVSLPAGSTNSPQEMARFYRKVASAALGDAKARRVGARQVDFVYLGDVQAPGATPRLRCRIYADPDKMDTVKKAIKSVYKDQADVVEIEEDELTVLAQVLRPPKGAEKPPAHTGAEEATE